MTSGCRKDIRNIDFGEFDFVGVIEVKPVWEIIIKCALIGSLLLVAILGNLLVIVIVSISRKMRTTTNYYIVNLAIADLLVACFPMWSYVTTDVTDGYILGAFFCKFNAFVQSEYIV